MSRFNALAALLVAFALDPTLAQETRPQAIKGWGTVVNPDGDCKFTEENGKLTITVPKTYHDLTHSEGRDKVNAPRVLQEVKGDFEIQVKVNTFPLPVEGTSTSNGICFVSSGLLLWLDEDNFIRMDRAALAGAPSPLVLVELYEKGKQASQKFEMVEDKATQLRITRSGRLLTFEASEDGKQWNRIHSEDVTLPLTLSAGVLAINTTTSDFAPQLEGLAATSK